MHITRAKNIVKQEIKIPAIDKAFPEPFIDFDLLSPIQLKIRPNIEKKNDNINPTIANSLVAEFRICCWGCK
ncbi:hypothetical protein [Metamycoplasma hominis]|uniref:hypothetical protein n=1 Tax=Metamycoplasma hominis TaxID=2098 RepID=UPI0015D66D5C|nr:hypothetical protein [Metamycoplasma hominis]MCF1354979.1 hypothetical protein [Metamycoplasma hominis]